MDNKGQTQFAGVAIAALTFLICMAIYGQVYGASNYNMFGVAVGQLINLLPLILVASTLIGVIIVAFKMSQ